MKDSIELLSDIAILAGTMRDAQKAYFRRRTPDLLVAAKLAEKSLDEALDAFAKTALDDLAAEGQRFDAGDDGQPTEMQEWRDYDRDC